jgi:hypothetical protein
MRLFTLLLLFIPALPAAASAIAWDLLDVHPGDPDLLGLYGISTANVPGDPPRAFRDWRDALNAGREIPVPVTSSDNIYVGSRISRHFKYAEQYRRGHLRINAIEVRFEAADSSRSFALPVRDSLASSSPRFGSQSDSLVLGYDGACHGQGRFFLRGQEGRQALEFALFVPGSPCEIVSVGAIVGALSPHVALEWHLRGGSLLALLVIGDLVRPQTSLAPPVERASRLPKD